MQRRLRNKLLDQIFLKEKRGLKKKFDSLVRSILLSLLKYEEILELKFQVSFATREFFKTSSI